MIDILDVMKLIVQKNPEIGLMPTGNAVLLGRITFSMLCQRRKIRHCLVGRERA
ncbi:MAG TPA: hypothetical protein VGK77_23550 [Candidatus Binatia bacterium]|jgi:hypothetical protein